MKFYIACLLSLSFLSGAAQITIEKVVSIDSYKSFQNYEHFKRLTLNTSDTNLEFLEGFNYDWGYTYSVKVAETKLAETRSDGTQYTYAFIEVVSKERESNEFQFRLYLDANRYYYDVGTDEQDMATTFKQLNDSTYLYFDEVEIEIPSALEEGFNRIFSGETAQLGMFIHLNKNRIRLQEL